MTRRLFVAVGLIVCLSPLGTGRLHAEPGFFLKEMPDLEVAIEEKPATADEAKRIKQLIQELAATNAPDIGYSASLAGDAFGPLSELDWRGTENITRYGLKHSDTVGKAGSFGPKAHCRSLLDALDDQTPTKLVLHSVCDYPKASVNPSRLGSYTVVASIAFQTRECPVVPAREILYNPLNMAEVRALKTADVIRMTSVRAACFGDLQSEIAGRPHQGSNRVHRGRRRSLPRRRRTNHQPPLPGCPLSTDGAHLHQQFGARPGNCQGGSRGVGQESISPATDLTRW